MRYLIINTIALFGLCIIARAELSPDDIKNLPPAKIKAALPDEHPAAYLLYAIRLFEEGKKDEAVFWFYVGQLRYRFHLKANPNLDPSGDAAIYSSLRGSVGAVINVYACGDVKKWAKAIDRALKWDADTANGFTSKKKFAAIYDENRAGLKKMRDELPGQLNAIREQRKKAGLEN